MHTIAGHKPISYSAIHFSVLLLFFTGLSLVLQILTGGYAADRGNHADEAAHFVSSLVIADYLSTGIPSNPVQFATDYYAHFPKVAIGHWPPVFEGLQALLFFIFGGTKIVALALQALIAGLCAAIPAAALGRLRGTLYGVLAGFIVLLCPVFLPMIDMVMADNLLAVGVTLTALAWSRFDQDRSWRWAALFAIAAASAILTKGTAFGLAFMPLIYLAMKRDFSLLWNPKTIVSALIVALLTLPWYALTYKMAADGWVYAWGWSYTQLAAPFFAGALVYCIGLPSALAYGAGIVLAARKANKPDPEGTQADITGFAATSLAMLLFAMIAPADLDRRYLIAALPCFAIVAVWGLAQIVDGLPQLQNRKFLAQGVTAAVVLVSLALVVQVPNIRSFRADELVQKIVASQSSNSLVLMSGTVMAEGAFVASFAERDPGKQHYVVRAQKALAKTNWMATEYELKFATAEAMAQWIKENEIGWVVVDTDTRAREFPHNALLKSAIDSGLLQAKQVAAVERDGGVMVLYSLPAVDITPKLSDKLLAALRPGHLGD